MKKFISLSIVAIMLVSMLSIGAFAADPTILYDFGVGVDNESKMGTQSKANVEYEAKEFYEVFKATGTDPYVSLDAATADDVSKVIWCKVRVYNPSEATAIELFGHTNGRGLTGSECTHINITPNTTEWKTYIIDISKENVPTVNAYKDPQYAIAEFYWEGTVDWIRLDPMWQEGDDGSDSGGSMDSGSEIWIDYIAFFSNEADAIAFKGDEELRLEAEAAAATTTEAAAETQQAETVAPETTPETKPAAQTADLAAVVVLAAVISLGTAIIIKNNKK